MISKKIFLAGLCAAVVTGSTLAKKTDDVSLNLLIQETADAFDRVADMFETTRSSYGNKIKEYEKALRNAKKRAIKKIKARLKDEYRSVKIDGGESFGAKKATYRAFKEQVYREWKSSGKLPSC